MKVLLATLMCMVLHTTQLFAIDGGPWNGNGHVTVTGTYAGVLVPILVAPDPAQPDLFLPRDNSLALFSLVIPQTGIGSGTAVVFRNGIFYNGSITGSADPDSGRLNALISAVFKEIFSSVTTTTGSAEQITSFYNANGKTLTTKIVAGTSGSATNRIKGRASLTYVNLRNDGSTPDPDGTSGGAIEYHVRGFKQSESTTALAGLAGGGSTGG